MEPNWWSFNAFIKLGYHKIHAILTLEAKECKMFSRDPRKVHMPWETITRLQNGTFFSSMDLKEKLKQGHNSSKNQTCEHRIKRDRNDEKSGFFDISSRVSVRQADKIDHISNSSLHDAMIRTIAKGVLVFSSFRSLPTGGLEKLYRPSGSQPDLTKREEYENLDLWLIMRMVVIPSTKQTFKILIYRMKPTRYDRRRL